MTTKRRLFPTTRRTRGEQVKDFLDLYEATIGKPETVLYVGAHPDRMDFVDYLKTRGAKAIDVIEIHKPNCDFLEETDLFREVIHGDVCEVQLGPYNLAFWWHGPEHVYQHKLVLTIARLTLVAKAIIVGCPWGRYEQGEVYGNPYEEHKSHLLPKDLEELGFVVSRCGKPNVPGSNLAGFLDVRWLEENE